VGYTLNHTFATAFYDIGRGKWSSYKRTVQDYMSYFSTTVSKIQSNLVVYCDQDHYDMISAIRPDGDTTKIIVTPFVDSEMYRRYYQRTHDVMNSSSFKSNIIHKDIPEMIYPEYNIINFNKISFVVDTMNHYDTKTYGWIDFGFGHGKVDVSADLSFLDNATSENRVYMGCLREPFAEMLYHPWSYFSNEIFITGSAFVGTRESVFRFKNLIEHVLDESLNRNMIDDDQTIYNMAYLQDKSLFNLKQGGWFNQFGGKQ
jgi:protein YibB